jgi:protein TonB
MKYLSCYLFVCVLLAGTPLFAQDADGIYTKVDEKPTPVKTAAPHYPSALKRDGISGLVAVQVVIDEKGKIVSATVVKTTHPEFERPALDAIEKWSFTPAKVGGNPVKMRITIPFRFNAAD